MNTFLIGDLHGHYRDYERLLQSAGLCDDALNWTGQDASLWLMGDFFDRGASGLKCVDLTMRLQQQALGSGGQVSALLGNHEMMLLCAWRFRDLPRETSTPLYDQWLRWGGIEADFDGFTQQHADWISDLPAMALVEDKLLMHADAMLYVSHGTSIESVNRSFAKLLQSDDLPAWEITLAAFGEHMAFSSLELTGQKRAEQMLALYGGNQLIHGHTPIPYAQRVEADTVTGAWEYANGKCINVDGGMYMGSPGFVYPLQ